MISGIVRPSATDGAGLEAWVDIAVAGDDRAFRTLAAVVDTGATDWLTLPEPVVQELGLRLRFLRDRKAVCAPGSWPNSAS